MFEDTNQYCLEIEKVFWQLTKYEELVNSSKTFAYSGPATHVGGITYAEQRVLLELYICDLWDPHTVFKSNFLQKSSWNFVRDRKRTYLLELIIKKMNLV